MKLKSNVISTMNEGTSNTNKGENMKYDYLSIKKILNKWFVIDGKAILEMYDTKKEAIQAAMEIVSD